MSNMEWAPGIGRNKNTQTSEKKDDKEQRDVITLSRCWLRRETVYVLINVIRFPIPHNEITGHITFRKVQLLMLLILL